MKSGKKMKRFHEENAKLNKYLTEKFRTETSKLYQSTENLKDRPSTNKECSEMKSHMTSLNNHVNDRIDHVIIDTKELTEKVTEEMDGKLSEVVNQVVTKKEQVEGRVSRLECHVKEVKSDLCNQMKSWQNEARDQLGTEVKQLDSHKARLDQVDIEWINLKCRLPECVAVNGNVSTLPLTDDHSRDNLGACGSANINVNDNNNDSTGGCNDVRDGTVNSDNMPCPI
jgi:hypothetical protein